MPSKISPVVLATFVIGLAVVFVVVWPPYFATLDGPQQVYWAYVLKTWPALSNWYDRSIPIASAGFPGLFLPLTLILPWTWAYRLALGGVAVLWCISSIALAKALHPGRTIVALLGSTLVLGWAMAMGFFSFLIGTALAGWGLASALEPQQSRASQVKTQFLLSLAVIAHIFPGALGLGAVVLANLFVEESLRDKLVRVASRMAIPAVLLVVLVGTTRQDVLLSGENVYLADTDRFFALAKMGMGGPDWRAWPPTLLAIAAAGRCLLQAKNRTGDRREWGLSGFVLISFVAATFAPLHLPGWMHFAPRFLPLALLMGVSLIPIERVPRNQAKIGLSVTMAFVVASVGWFGHHFRQLSAAVEPLLAVTRAPLQRSGVRLPILASDPWFAGIGTMDAPFPFADPGYNIPLLAAVEQGGIVPYTFTTSRSIHPFVDRNDHPPLPKIPAREHYWLGLVDPEVRAKPGLRQALLVDLASHASRFDDVILFGPVDDQKAFEQLGFESHWHSEAGIIATFQGCPVKLGIKASDDAPANLHAAYGWFPVMKPMWSGTITRAGALTKIDLPGAPCGPIWIDVWSDETRVTCAGAQPDGRLLALDRTNQKGVVCSLQ